MWVLKEEGSSSQGPTIALNKHLKVSFNILGMFFSGIFNISSCVCVCVCMCLLSCFFRDDLKSSSDSYEENEQLEGMNFQSPIYAWKYS